MGRRGPVDREKDKQLTLLQEMIEFPILRRKGKVVSSEHMYPVHTLYIPLSFIQMAQATVRVVRETEENPAQVKME